MEQRAEPDSDPRLGQSVGPFPGTSPVFLAKLRPPSAGALVRRGRLLALLDDVGAAPVVLLSAPAGSGKTSLLASWVAETTRPLAWLSLDEWDRDPVRMWTGILAAMDSLVPGVAAEAEALLTQGGSFEKVVASLLNALEAAALPDAVMVVDDVHVVDDDPETVQSLTQLLIYLPEGLHLVLSGRRRPHLPVDRLRAQGRLREVSFEELRFSPDEAAAMLRRLVPDLSQRDLVATTDRAAGWAASLQFSGLAARVARAQPRSSDPGNADRQTDDYLWREVLAEEAPAVIDVLNAAALVERVNGDLARAVSGHADAAHLVEQACDHGLFLSRLWEPGWFELHSVVRQLLREDLQRKDPGGLAEMHARAACWYEAAGDAELAVKHWLAAAQPREALRAVAVNNGALYDAGRDAVVRQAVAQLSAEVAITDVSAALDYAWAHLLVDRRVLLDVVDRLLEQTSGNDLDAATRGRLSMLRSVASLDRGQWDDTGTLAQEGLAHLGPVAPHDHLGRFAWNLVARHLALTERWAEDSPAVVRAAHGAHADPGRRAGFEGTRALGLALAGRPSEALRVAQAAADGGNVASRSILSLELALATGVARRELGDRDRARSELEALAQRPMTPLPYVPFRALLELTECHLGTGRLEEAVESLAAARSLLAHDFSGPGPRTWADTVETCVAVAGGDLARAEAVALRIDDEAWGPIALARVRLAQQDVAGASQALQRARPRSVRHSVLLDLLGARAASSPGEALEGVGRAADLAARHGITQSVAAECGAGAGVLELLERAADLVPESWLDRVRQVSVNGGVAVDGAAPGGLQDLTVRERDILRMLPSRLTVGEIADELHLSRNTVKFHLKVIYRKLGCSTRAEAASAARAMSRVGAVGRAEADRAEAGRRTTP